MTARAQQRAQWQTRFRSAATPRRVNLHVGELEFQGVGRSTANRIASAFEYELGYLLSSGGVPRYWNAGHITSDLRATMRAGNTDYATGEALARAVVNSHVEGRFE